MGTTRTSNKDIADKLDTLIELMTAQAMAAQSAAPVATVVATPEAAVAASPKQKSIRISQDYLAKMQPKWQSLANSKGTVFIGYAYKKRNGKNGLWACPAADFAEVSKRDSTIGAVLEVHPQ